MDWWFHSNRKKKELSQRVYDINEAFSQILNFYSSEIREPSMAFDYLTLSNNDDGFRISSPLCDYNISEILNRYRPYIYEKPEYTTRDEFESLFSLYNQPSIPISNPFDSTRREICLYRYTKKQYERITFIFVSNIFNPETITAHLNVGILKLIVFIVDKLNSLLAQIKILEIKILEKISTILNLSRSKFVLDLISRPPPTYKAI